MKAPVRLCVLYLWNCQWLETPKRSQNQGGKLLREKKSRHNHTMTANQTVCGVPPPPHTLCVNSCNHEVEQLKNALHSWWWWTPVSCRGFTMMSSNNMTKPHPVCSTEQRSSKTKPHLVCSTEQRSSKTKAYPVCSTEQRSRKTKLHTVCSTEQRSSKTKPHTVCSTEQRMNKTKPYPVCSTELRSSKSRAYPVCSTKQQSSKTMAYPVCSTEHDEVKQDKAIPSW